MENDFVLTFGMEIDDLDNIRHSLMPMFENFKDFIKNNIDEPGVFGFKLIVQKMD